jgi:multidrug efflux pump subunit AcrA (membrane-fusion protein)
VLFAVAPAGYHRFQRPSPSGDLPTAQARQGEFLVIVQCRGELTARRSVQVTAPLNVPDLRIVWLAPQGGPVQAGDVVVRFDSSNAASQLREKEAALKEAEAALAQAMADAKLTAGRDGIELVAARHSVERARLEASKKEIVSRIQGEESRIDLGVAEEKLNVQQAATDLNKASAAAKIASLTSQRDKAQAEVDLLKDRLAKMELRAPLDGIVVYLVNYSSGWADARPFKVGDNVWPGSTIAEVPDMSALEMKGKLEEVDRGRVRAGNEVRVRLDALPEIVFPAEVSTISPLTEMTFEWPPVRSFRAYARILEKDARLRPAMQGRMDIVVDRLPDAISVPAKAVFTQAGKPVLYVAGKSGFQAVPVEIVARNPDELAVRGLAPGAVVALVEPERRQP